MPALNNNAVDNAIIFLIYFPPVNAEFGGTELQKRQQKNPDKMSGDESYLKNRNPAPLSTTVRNIWLKPLQVTRLIANTSWPQINLCAIHGCGTASASD
jgi:hypothetical protein